VRVDFYHLQASPVEKALPQLLERVLAGGHRALVMAASEERIEALANLLWTYNPESWLPHGTVKDGYAGTQPIWLTTLEENPNGAGMLVLTDGMSSSRMGDFERCLDLFDGTNPEATAAARTRWSAAKAAGCELHYWQQTDSGWKEQGAA
jgi:DNA polymerase III subunit chi